MRTSAPIITPFLACLLSVVAAAAAVTPPPPPSPPAGPVVERVEIRGEAFRLEIAADAEARRQGLSGREELKPHFGMIFIYPDARPRTFWMYECLIDIDLIYLDATGRVVAAHRMKAERPRQPRETEWSYTRRLERYRSRRPAQFAIEVESGTIERLKLRPGQVITLDLERLKKLAE